MEDNIFSGLKVVDLSSFIAGPSAAVILSDFGADVIKVEPPQGDAWRHAHRFPPQPLAEDAYQWHLANRNKRSIALDLKNEDAAQVLFKLVNWADVLIVNTPHKARKKLQLEYGGRVGLEPAADLCGSHRLRGKGAGRRAAGLRHHLLLGAKRVVVDDTRRRPAADLAGRRQRRQRHRDGPLRRDRDGALQA